MERKNLKILPLLLAFVCSGCIVYPRLYWQKESGQATIKDGKPITIKGQIIKECDRTDRISEKIEDEKTVTTDAKGFYDFTLRAFLWEFQNFLTDASCSSHVQLYTCEKTCKPVDSVDINVLGE